MSERTVLYWGHVEVSEKDADLLDRDVMLYGNAYVEVFEKGLAKRIDPRRIGTEVTLLDSVDLGIMKEEE